MTNEMYLHLHNSLTKTNGKDTHLSGAEGAEVYGMGNTGTLYTFMTRSHPRDGEQQQMLNLRWLFSKKYTPGPCSQNLPPQVAALKGMPRRDKWD